MQLYTDIYLLLNYSICFGRPSRPSSEVYITVVAASGTNHTTYTTYSTIQKKKEKERKRRVPETMWSGMSGESILTYLLHGAESFLRS